MKADPRSLFLVAAGGAVGASARWAVVAGAVTTGAFPWWTLLVNVLGCFGLGLLARASRTTALALGTGVCGGLTTFSTFSLELAVLLDGPLEAAAPGGAAHGAADPGVAVLYVAASLVLGISAVAAGRRVVSA